MDYIYIGKIVNTHGIKGEIRILSDFEKKDLIFKNGFTLYAGNSKMPMKIDSYRKHKNFDMIKFNDLNDIKDVLIYKSQNVYIKRDDINLKENEYLITDLIGLNAYYNNELIGVINNVSASGNNKLLIINGNIYIPYNEHFLKEVDLKNKKVELKEVEGLI